jgi:drug/metabolite transporter (DMT)-like permease
VRRAYFAAVTKQVVAVAYPSDAVTAGTRNAALHGWAVPLQLALLGAIWGASFLFMRIAAGDLGAVPLVELRLGFGALVLLPFLWVERRAFRAEHWPRIALIGLVNSAVPFTLFAWAAQRAPAGVGAITNSMAVLFTALVAFLFWGERIGRVRVLALLAGFAGVVVLASSRTDGASVGAAAAAGTFAAFLYGVAGNLIRRWMHDLPPVALACATLICAALLQLPLAVASWPQHSVATASWLSAAALGLLCTGVAYALYFRLLQRIGPTRASTVTYLVPLFAIGWAWLLLSEPLTPAMAIAGALILGSVALSQRAR